MDIPTKYGSYNRVGERHKKRSVRGVWKNIKKSLVSRGYSSGLINIENLSVNSSTVAAKKGQQIGFDGHKKTKGSEIRVAVTSQFLPIAIDLGSGNEHESRSFAKIPANFVAIHNSYQRQVQRTLFFLSERQPQSGT